MCARLCVVPHRQKANESDHRHIKLSTLNDGLLPVAIKAATPYANQLLLSRKFSMMSRTGSKHTQKNIVLRISPWFLRMKRRKAPRNQPDKTLRSEANREAADISTPKSRTSSFIVHYFIDCAWRSFTRLHFIVCTMNLI
jgi:hypothetical protein